MTLLELQLVPMAVARSLERPGWERLRGPFTGRCHVKGCKHKANAREAETVAEGSRSFPPELWRPQPSGIWAMPVHLCDHHLQDAQLMARIEPPR